MAPERIGDLKSMKHNLYSFGVIFFPIVKEKQTKKKEKQEKLNLHMQNRCVYDNNIIFSIFTLNFSLFYFCHLYTFCWK